MRRTRPRRGAQSNFPVRAASYPALVSVTPFSALAVTSGDDTRMEWADPTKPPLRADYRVPQTGAGRRTALDEGLCAPWRIHAAHDDSERLRSESAADAFSVHLLTNDVSWAVLVISNSHWIGERDRHALLQSRLHAAPSAPTLGALLGHFTSQTIPLALPYSVRENARLDVLDLLLGCDHPDRASVEFMVAMSGLAIPVAEWCSKRARALHTRRLTSLDVAIGNALQERNLYQPERMMAITRDLMDAWRTHWDPVTHSPTPDYVPAVRALLQHHLTNTLDGVLDDLIATNLGDD